MTRRRLFPGTRSRRAVRLCALVLPLALLGARGGAGGAGPPFAILAGPAAQAQAPEAWRLDHFEVVWTEEDRETDRRIIAGGSEHSFAWGGRFVNEHLGPVTVTGTLRVELPDAIVPGVAFSIGGGASGQVSTPGRGETTAVTLGANGDCYLREVCLGTAKNQYLPEAGGRTVDLAVTMPPVQATLPTDPQLWPSSHVLLFRGGLGTTTPGDVYWRIRVYAYYRRPAAVPTPMPGYRLELDADTRRLPPSGAAPSEARLTARISDSAGRPAAGASLRFSLEPPDLGRLSAAAAQTDARGEAAVTYRAPTAAELRGRSQVTVLVEDPARGLSRRLGLDIERYRLALTVDPAELPIEPVWRAVRVRAAVTDFEGRPVAGERLAFRVDPPDLGEVIGERIVAGRGSTDGAGRLEGFFEPPSPERLAGRDRVTVYVANLDHGGEEGAQVVFKGLRLLDSQPSSGSRDVQLGPGPLGKDRELVLTFDRALDSASVNAGTVHLGTLWHGAPAARLQVEGQRIRLAFLDPLPDMGLRLSVTLDGGPSGLKGADGSLMAGPRVLRLSTLPRLQPRIIASQVVDNPRDPIYDYISLALKPFVLRVEGGLPADSELDEERVVLRLSLPRRGETFEQEHRFYPGSWPPSVPAAAAAKGNSANIVICPPFGRGGYTAEAELLPLFADGETVFKAPTLAFNVNSWSDPAAVRGLGVLAVPIVNDRLPGFAWTLSRGQQEAWLLGLGPEATQRLPLGRLNLRLSYLADTTCHDPEACKHETAPWTSFLYWTQQLGRTGFMTRLFGWRYIVGVVPPRYFEAYADHPDVAANPGSYHDAPQSGIWYHRPIAREGRAPAQSLPIALVEADVSPAALVHVLGDIEGLADHGGDRDALAGYDLLGDRRIYADDERWTGASISMMNLGVGFGASWPSAAEYVHFMGLWTQRSCAGPPPCPPRFGTQSDRPAQAPGPAAPPALLVSGILRRDAAGRLSGRLDPLVPVEGPALLQAGSGGDIALELRDAAGALLGRYPVEPDFRPAGDVALAGLLTTVPRAAGAASLAVVQGSTPFLLRRRSAAAPTVRWTLPQAGGRHGGRLDLRWAMVDADGDPLSATVLYSADDGATWEPLLIDSPADRFDLDSALLGSAPQARLRVVVSDGFDAAADEVVFGLDNPPAALAVHPPDGARGVPVRSQVQVRLRDPVDPASLPGALTLRDAAGSLVQGQAGYSAIDRTVVLTPSLDLAPGGLHEARLSGALRRADGRALGADLVWQFRTAGPQAHLPFALQSGNAAPRPPAPSATRSPGSPPPPPASPTRAASRTPSSPTTPTLPPTPDIVGTAVAATLTALAPSPTAGAPTSPPATASATASPPPTATALDAGAVMLDALTTGADNRFMRMAFVPGDTVIFWTEVQSGAAAARSLRFDYELRDAEDRLLPALSWSGEVAVPPGRNWFQLERVLPAGMAPGPLHFRGRLTDGGRVTEAEAELWLGRSLRAADDFSDAASGWPAGQDEAGPYGYAEGEYRIRLTAADRGRWVSPPGGPRLDDLLLEADLRLPEAAAGAAGLVFGLNADSDDYHLWQVDRAGQYAVYRHAGGAWQTLLSPRPAEALRQGEARNHLLLVRDRGLTRLYANGRLVSLVTDLPAPAGRTGVYAGSAAAGFEARWDNLRAYDLR